MKKFTATQSSTLRDFTDATYPQGSFVFSSLLKKGDIRVNGVKVRANVPINAGDEVTYYTTPAQEAKPSHSIVYEDENILIADKSGGVSCEALFCELNGKGAYFPVHRIDRNTCGLVALAKNEGAERELAAAFRERRAEKIYLCFAKNAFRESAAKLTAYISKNAEESTVRVYPTPAEGRVRIVTEYEVLKSYGDYALVKVVLHTGKTHQIRAHLAYIGCPLLGDEKYGDRALNKKYRAARQILVAHDLSFTLGGALSYLNGRQFTSAYFPALPEG